MAATIIEEARETELQFTEPPSLTWRLNLMEGRIEKRIDGLESIVQSAMMALETERFLHLIFSWDYGSELKTLLGREKDYAFSEAKRMIADALSTDTRITAVRDFEWRDGVIRFTLDTVFGMVTLDQEVMLDERKLSKRI